MKTYRVENKPAQPGERQVINGGQLEWAVCVYADNGPFISDLAFCRFQSNAEMIADTLNKEHEALLAQQEAMQPVWQKEHAEKMKALQCPPF